MSLSLGLLENAAEFLRFGLQFCNHSEVNLLLPYPEIHGLRFGNKATLQESEWYTGILMRSSDWAGFTLGPGHTKSFEYRVRPTHVAPDKWAPPLRLNVLGDSAVPWSTYAKIIVDTATASQSLFTTISSDCRSAGVSHD